MMEDDPNPRVHRLSPTVAINLAECAAIIRKDGATTRVYLRNGGGMRCGDIVVAYVDFLCSEDESGAFLDAFQMWGTAR